MFLHMVFCIAGNISLSSLSGKGTNDHDGLYKKGEIMMLNKTEMVFRPTLSTWLYE